MKHYKNRLICYLDVLGFSTMVKDRGIQEVYDKYASFIDEAKNKVFFGTPDNYVGPIDNFEVSEIVSDSVILISHDVNNVASVNNFIGSIHLFLELGLTNGFMFRGCVSQGDIIFDKERNIVLSKEFNDMAKFEPRIDTSVCIIFESAKTTIINSIFGENKGTKGIQPSRALPVIKSPIPLKKSKKNGYSCITIEDYWCINYTFFSDRTVLEGAIDYLQGDPAKQQNFIGYLNFLGALPEEVLILDGEQNTHIKIMKSRSGIRAAIASNDGTIIQPSTHWGFPEVFVEPPPKITVFIDPETQQIHFNKAEGSWY